MALRGDLTLWLLEISAGVFVGQVSARVRDALWSRVQKTCKNGRATLVYSAAGEQRLGFRVHGDVWEPIDFDGLKLMLRPSVSRLIARQSSASSGFSNAAKRRQAKRFSTPKVRYPRDYVVVDIETTGLSPDADEIIEIGALKVINGKVSCTFHTFVRIEGSIPVSIMELTGITDDMLREGGQAPQDALKAFVTFLSDMPIVAHNASFDMNFLLRACKKQGLPLLTNRSIDTHSLTRRLVKSLLNYKLETVAKHLGITQEEAHRGIGDCETTRLVYEKLIEMVDSPIEKPLE
jgi:CRISPR-associated protein Cas2